MEPFGYGEHIANTVRNIPYEAAIQTEDIAAQLAARFAIPYDKARTATNVKLKRMADKGEIERLKKGVYCHVKQTVFGKAVPNVDAVMTKTLVLHNGEKIGYESGAFLLNKLGLTTLVPRNIEITTNRSEVKLPEGCHIKVRRPAASITNENWRYLQFIDVVRELPNAHIDAENPEQLLARYAEKQQLDSLTLIFTARKHYAEKVVLRLVDLLMEV